VIGLAVHPGDLRHHGVRADRGMLVECSRQDPLHLDVAALHIGQRLVRRLLPRDQAFAIVASTGDIYAGPLVPIIFAAITAVIGFFFLPETKTSDITK